MKTKITFIALIFFALAFTNQDKSPFKVSKQISNDFAFIPSGNVERNDKTVSVQAFYMSKTEISNQQYNTFLADLKAKNETAKLKIAGIDSNNWVTEFGDGGKNYAAYYQNHLAYQDYPVVNIDKAGAELYCVWLTEKLNTENPGLEIIVRLPTQSEWFRACNPTNNAFPYSWEGPYLRNEKGLILCNFTRIGEENISYNQQAKAFELKDLPKSKTSASKDQDLTAPVKSYFPSSLGLYNLNGNVAELTADGLAMGGSWKSGGYDVRNESSFKSTGASVSVGFRPVFSVQVKK